MLFPGRSIGDYGNISNVTPNEAGSTDASAREPTFRIPQDRDAWATIRGFVFQADLTIERWLLLENDQELQLETGEDIDTVSRFVVGDEVAGRITEERLLEQIKHRETNVTLKSASSLGALTNAFGHRRSNPGLRLQFRYTTNARVGKERFSPFLGNLKGIEVWERLRGGDLPPEEETMLFDGVRLLLGGATRPDDVSEDAWSEFTGFISGTNDEELRNFIVGFEWSTGVTAAEEMADRIQALLLDQGRADDALAAYSRYQQLFLHVLKTLTRREGKRLSVTHLEEVLRQPLSSDDRDWFEGFLREAGLLDRKLAFLQAQMARQEQVLHSVAEQVGRIADMSRVQALTLAAPLPIFEPPPVGEFVIPRTETVGHLLYEINQHTWLALVGASGTGKSHLALLLAARIQNCPVWLRFRDQNTEAAAKNLDAVFLYLNGGMAAPSRLEWYSDVCRRFGEGALLVLDDLPVLLPGDALAERLEYLSRACRGTQTTLVTTSVHRLPGPLLRATRGRVVEKAVPPLTDIEALEILRAYGGPSTLLADMAKVRFLNNVARRHPSLLSAVALYLSTEDWQWTDQQLDDLMLGRFADEVNDETIRRLLMTITDERSREFLYRLNLILGPFDQATARLVAGVEPVVPAPRERLTQLTGLWVQRDTREKLRVSPLVQVLGSEDLEDAIRNDCRRVLARQIFERGSVGSTDLETAITYLGGAGEHDEAVQVLLWSLAHVRQGMEQDALTPNQVRQTGLLRLYGDIPLPPSVEPNNRLLLRSYQIMLGKAVGGDVSYPVADIVRHIDAAGPEAVTGLLSAATFGAAPLADYDFDASCRVIEKAVATLIVADDGTLPDGSPVALPDGISPGALFWMSLGGVRSKTEVLRWCDMLATAPANVRAQALEDPVLSDQAASLLIDRFWLAETNRPEEEQDWERVLGDLDEIEGKAREVGAGFLVATAVRGKVLVLCEQMRQPDQAVALAEDKLRTMPDDPRGVFMVCEAVGRKLSFLDGREAEAQDWLESAEEAVNRAPNALHWERAMALLAQARLADKRGDTERAAALLERAVGMVRTSKFYPEIEMVKFLGDQAIAEWKRGRQDDAFNALDDAVPRLLEHKAANQEWRALFTLFGHTAGYMTSMASTGVPPELSTGDEPYVLPPVGNFHDSKEELLAAIYDVRRDLALPALLAEFADALGKEDRVVYWADQCIQMAEDAPAAALIVSKATLGLLPHLVHGDRLVQLFNGAREATFTSVAAMCLFRRGDTGLLLKEIDVAAALGERGSEDWDYAEVHTLATTLVPLTLHLGRLVVRANRGDDTAANQVSRDCWTAVALCLESATASIKPELWREAAQIIETCYLHPISLDAAIRKASDYGEEEKPLRAATYLGATLHSSANLASVCEGHITVTPFYLRYLHGRSGYRLLLLPFIEEYWHHTVAQRRFAFSTPNHVVEAFERARREPELDRAEKMLQAVSSGLRIGPGFSVVEAFRDWREGRGGLSL